MKRHAILLLALLTLACLPGCAVLAREVFLSPTAVGASGKHDMSHDFYHIHLIGSRDDLQFELPGLDLSVTGGRTGVTVISFGPFLIVPLPVIPYPFAILDLFESPSSDASTVGFHLRLQPMTAGFTFDPGLVILKTDNGENIKPKSFWGPALGKRYQGRWPCGQNWGNASNLRKETPGILPLTDLTCLGVTFDTASFPDRKFVLSIEGVQRNGEPFPIPSIYFERGSAWVLFVGP